MILLKKDYNYNALFLFKIKMKTKIMNISWVTTIAEAIKKSQAAKTLWEKSVAAR